MKFLEILVIFSVVCVFTNAENKHTKHDQNYLHERSHQSRIQQEKSQNRYHTLNRNKQYKSENLRRNHVRNFIYRDGNENGKPSSNCLELQVDYNGNAGLIGIVNKTSNIALVFDGHNNVTALINEQSGVVIVIDINSKLIYRISNTQAVDLKSGFDAYFQNLSSLQPLLNDGQQSSEKYNFSSINPSVLGDLSSLGFGRSCSSDDLNQIPLFTSQLEGSLALLYQNKGSFNITKNAEWFVSLNLVFAKLLDDNRELHVQFALEPVFGASSGVEALLSFLSQIGKHEDLSKLLLKCLTSPEQLLSLVLDVSKGSNDGIDGVITILAKIFDVITGKGSVSDVVNSLMNYKPELQGSSPNISQIISETLDLIRSQNASFQNFPAFERIFNILTALSKNDIVLNLIKLLQNQNPREILQTIMKITSQFIPQLMNYIGNIPDFGNIFQTVLKGNISQILSNANVTSLLSNFPVLGDFIQSVMKGSFSQILSNANVTSFLSNFPVLGDFLQTVLKGNFSEILSNFPVLGDFIRRISSYLGNGFDIGLYLNSSSILGGFNNMLGGNSPHGLFGNIIDTFRNGVSGVESGVEHGISGLVGAATGVFLGSDSGHGTSESSSGNPTNESASTGGLQLNGFAQLSNRKISHGNHNLHGKKENKLHHNFQDRKPQHEHGHPQN